MIKKILLAVAALIVVGVIAILLLPQQPLTVGSSATSSFVIDVPMQRVRKILVRTNAVKKIVAMADAKVQDQKWLKMKFDADRRLLDRDWQLDGTGELVVQINDAYLGQHDITLQQSVDIAPTRLHSTNTTDGPQGPVQKYESEFTLVESENGKAKFDLSLNLEIQTTANLLTRSRVESEIKAAAARSLEKQEKAIREVVDEQKDKLLILPDFNRN